MSMTPENKLCISIIVIASCQRSVSLTGPSTSFIWYLIFFTSSFFQHVFFSVFRCFFFFFCGCRPVVVVYFGQYSLLLQFIYFNIPYTIHASSLNFSCGFAFRRYAFYFLSCCFRSFSLTNPQHIYLILLSYSYIILIYTFVPSITNTRKLCNYCV